MKSRPCSLYRTPRYLVERNPFATGWVLALFILLIGRTTIVIGQEAETQPDVVSGEALVLMPFVRESGKALFRMDTPVMPTFMGPEIEMDIPTISNLRYTADSGYSGDILVKGEVISLVDFRSQMPPKRFHDGYIYVNGELLKGARIKAGRLHENQAGGTPAATSFETLIASVSLTEGNNIIEIVFRDPMTGMEGSQSYSIQVAFAENPEALPAPIVSEIGSGQAHEWNPFILASTQKLGTVNPNGTFIFQDDSAKEGFKLRKFAKGPGGYLVDKAGGSEPLSFLLLPSRQALRGERFEASARMIEGIQDFPGMTDREHFLLGLSFGWFAHGADIITSRGDYFPGVVDLDVAKGGLILTFDQIDESGNEDSLTLNLPAGFTKEKMTQDAVGDFAELMWEVANLYRSGNSQKDEVALGLLVSDFSSFGSDIEMSGWTSEFLIKTAEIIDEMNESMSSARPVDHGFYIGASLSVVSQIDLPRPGYAASDEVWDRPLMSDVLSYYINAMGPLSGASDRSEVVRQRISPEAIPEKYRSVWPYLSWFYEREGHVDSSSGQFFGDVLPESVKHPLISPVLVIIAVICLFGGSIWMLVVQFQTSLGWGFGQLGANFASCLLVIPGLILTIVFCAMHWRAARRPLGLQLLAFLIGPVAQMFIPEWATALSE